MASPIRLRTPLGIVTVEWRTEGLTSVTFGPYLGRGGPAAFSDPEVKDPALRTFILELKRYFSRAEVILDPPLALLRPGTSFQRSVWTATRRIPYGQVRTYGWLAQRIGRPRAVRAVGTALARNPIPLVVPCHRVVPATGGLGGFGGGLNWKRALLDLEGASISH